jgi:hypothetical protein
MIDISSIPVEPTVTIFNPDGSELITTNNVTTFTWIRLEIKKNKLRGYKVKTANGDIFDIRPNGKIYDENYRWPDEIAGNVFDSLLIDLV